MSDVLELPADEFVPLIDPEAHNDPTLSLPEPEDPNPRPAPEVTSWDSKPADVEWPKSLTAVQKKAEALGWDARPGYSRGFVSGIKKSSWKLREEACLWLHKDGRPRLAFSWERSPESQAKGGPAWKADKVLALGGGMARAYGHLEGRKLL